MIKRIFLAGIILLMAVSTIGCEDLAEDVQEARFTRQLSNALSDLDSDDPKVKEAAIYTIVLYSNQRGIRLDDLLEKKMADLGALYDKIIRDPDEAIDVRVAAIRTYLPMTDYYWGDVTESFRDVRDDPDPRIRASLFEIYYFDVAEYDYFLLALQDSDRLVREKAALKIGRLAWHHEAWRDGREEFAIDEIPLLNDMIGDVDLDTRVAGALALAALNEFPSELEEILVEGLRSSIYFQDIISTLHNEEKNQFPGVVDEMLNLLGRPLEGTPILEALLRWDPDTDIVEYLAKNCPDSILPSTIERLAPTEVAIFRAPGKLNSGSSTGAITFAFRKTMLLLRFDDGTTEYLRPFRPKGGYGYYRSLIFRLAELSNKEKVVDAIAILLDSEDENVRSSAARALGKIGPPAGKTIPRLGALLHESEPYEKWSYQLALGNLGLAFTDEVVPIILSEMQDVRNLEPMDDAIAILGPLLKDAEDELWQMLEIAETTNRMDGVVDSLVAICREDEDYIHKLIGFYDAGFHTERLGEAFVGQGPEALEFLIAESELGFEDAPAVPEGISSAIRFYAYEKQDEYINFCLEKIKHEDEQIRLNAVIFTRVINKDFESVIEVLEDAAENDESERVRTAALEAIELLSKIEMIWSSLDSSTRSKVFGQS